MVTALTQLLHQTIKYKLHKYQTITFISSKKLGYLFLRIQKKKKKKKKQTRVELEPMTLGFKNVQHICT